MELDSVTSNSGMLQPGKLRAASSRFSITHLLGGGEAPTPSAMSLQKASLSPNMMKTCEELRLTALLVEAIEEVDLEKVSQLLYAGAPVNHADSNGWTPLHFAARKRDANLCHLLCERGADPTKRTNDHHSAIDIALSHGNTACVSVMSAFWPVVNSPRKQRHDSPSACHCGSHDQMEIQRKDWLSTNVFHNVQGISSFYSKSQLLSSTGCKGHISTKSSGMSLDADDGNVPSCRHSLAVPRSVSNQGSPRIQRVSSTGQYSSPNSERPVHDADGRFVMRKNCSESARHHSPYARCVSQATSSELRPASMGNAFSTWAERAMSTDHTELLAQTTNPHGGALKSESDPQPSTLAGVRDLSTMLQCPPGAAVEKAFSLIDAYTRQAESLTPSLPTSNASNRAQVNDTANVAMGSPDGKSSQREAIAPNASLSAPWSWQAPVLLPPQHLGVPPANDETLNSQGETKQLAKQQEQGARRKAAVAQDSFNWKKTGDRQCAECEATETPQWRGGPGGSATLCNACGLKYFHVQNREKKNARRREKYMLQKTKKQWAKISATMPFGTIKGNAPTYRPVPTCFS